MSADDDDHQSKRKKVADRSSSSSSSSSSTSGSLQDVLILVNLTIGGLPTGLLSLKPNPFLTITYGKEMKFSTETIDSTTNPEWKDMQIPFPFDQAGLINIEVRDSTTLITNKGIATIQFRMEDLRPKFKGEPTVRFTGNGNNNTTFDVEWRVEQWNSLYGTNNTGKDPSIDTWTWLVLKSVRAQVDAMDTVYAPSIKPPHEPPQVIPVLPLPGQGLDYIKVAKSDPDCSLPTGAGAILKAINTTPMDDKSAEYQSRGQGNAFARKKLPPTAPPIEGPWAGDITSDENFIRFCFLGSGASFMSKTKDGYKCDASDLYNFATRNNYVPYGATAYFDDSGRPTHIDYGNGKSAKPDGSTDWEFAKLASRTSFFIKVSLVHLMHCHFHWANDTGLALRTHLPISHPIRRLVAPHMYRSAMVLVKSLASLTPRKGMFDRAIMFVLADLQRAMKTFYDSHKFDLFLNDLQKRGMDKAPEGLNRIYEDAVPYAKTVSDYVSEYIDLYYKNEEDVAKDNPLRLFWTMLSGSLKCPSLSLTNMKVVLGEIILRTSAWHTNVGNVAGYLNDASGISCRLQPGKLTNAVESHLITAMIGIVTSEPMPTMLQDWSQFFIDPQAKEVYSKFKRNLRDLSDHIKEKNQKARFPLADFDPEFVTLSVAS